MASCSKKRKNENRFNARDAIIEIEDDPPVKSKKKKIDDSSEFPTDWDIDFYKTEYESEEHWALRRRFMQVHKKMFPEDRVVCLAQVFTNIEFMGCRYPAETMRLVGELSQDVAKEFRAERASRLKRTFVTASDAAEQRAKGRRTTQQPPQQQEHKKRVEAQRKCFGTGDSQDIFAGLKYDNFVLFLAGGRQCLRQSALRCNIEYLEGETIEGGKKKLTVSIGGKVVATACEETIKESKLAVYNRALEHLQQTCYTIKPNPKRDTVKIEKSNNEIVLGVTQQPADSVEDKKLDASNKGYRMMKLMGWTGGGLGSKKEGREDPVCYLLKNNRCGLGSQCKMDKNYFTAIIRNYIKSDDIRELQFEPTFSKEERALLHQIAGQFHLKSASYGTGDERRLVISKRINNKQILTEILLNQNQKYCDAYFVQAPESKFQQYPAHVNKLELD